MNPADEDPAQLHIPGTEGPEDKLQVILRLVAHMNELEDEVASAEAALEEKKSKLRHVSEKLLPDLFEQLGLTELRVRGRKVEIKTDYFANISKARKVEAFAWLREHNMGGMIKEEITVPPDLKDQLQASGIPFSVDEAIHASTLKSFVREQLEAGNTLPQELLGVHVAHKVVVHHG